MEKQILTEDLFHEISREIILENVGEFFAAGITDDWGHPDVLRENLRAFLVRLGTEKNKETRS